MTPAIASALLPLLRRIDPERAHDLALARLAPRPGRASARPPTTRRWPSTCWAAASPIRSASPPASTRTPSPSPALMRLGFGFVETGTVTPRPQPGNPRPRLFRLEQDRAVINRWASTTPGSTPISPTSRAPARTAVPLGANVGINKEGADPERDYPALIAAVAPLRRLRGDQRLLAQHAGPARPARRGAAARHPARRRRRVPHRPPVLVKIAPDLCDEAWPRWSRPASPRASRA